MKFIYSMDYGERRLQTIMLTDRFDYDIEISHHSGVDYVDVTFNDDGEEFHTVHVKIPKGEGENAIEFIERLLVERISTSDCVYLDSTVYLALARCEIVCKWKVEE